MNNILLPVKKTLGELGVMKFQPSEVLIIPHPDNANVLIQTIIEKKNQEKPPTTTPAGFYLIGVTQEDIRAGGFLGIEFETRFEPTGPEVRRMKDFILKHQLMPSISGQYDIFRCLRNQVLNNLSESLIDGPPVQDGGGVELRFHPTTLSGHHQLREEYIRIIKIVQSFGFSDKLGGDGIHINIDKALLGSSISAQKETLTNFIWFLFKAQDFMIEFCARSRPDDQLADLLSLLGNRLGNMGADQLAQVFLQEKNSLLNALIEDLDHRAMNIHINKNGRPCLEFRWFGSTHSTNKFMSFIEFCHAIMKYCREVSTRIITLNGFCDFVKKNKKDYGDLYTRMCKLATTEKLMKERNTATQVRSLFRPIYEE